MRSLGILLALTGLVMIAVPPAGATVITVPGDHARITDALSAAVAGDSILVAAGTYSPTTNGESYPLVITTLDITLLGAGMELSVLNADSTGSVIEIDTTGFRISGFTLTEGVTILGGGIHVLSGDPEISGCLIRDCFASTRGAGIHVATGASPWVHHNVIWENGDTFIPSGGDPHGIQLLNCSGLVEHNLIGMGDSNGLFTEGTTDAIIRNNIFYQNGTPELRGRGICALATPAPQIDHNLFFGNVLSSILMRVNGTLYDLTASAANDSSLADAVFGNLDGDPLFVDEANYDWQLMFGSPAIDNGNPGSPLDPDGTQADIGPFYFPQDLVAVEGSPPPPLQFGPAWPNPFRGRTHLAFTQPTAGPVRLAIFDVRGKEVSVLVDGTLPAGSHQYVWAGGSAGQSRVAPGVYFARLQIGSQLLVQRAIFIR